MASAGLSPSMRFEEGSNDARLCADNAKGEKMQGTPKQEAEANHPGKSPVEKDCSEHAEATGRATKRGKEDAASLEEALAKQRLVRSVLCTRVIIPAAEEVSNRVLRAVLRGDKEELAEAVKRKRLKGVAVALAADDRQRTALHMAAGTRNVRMIQALMQYWRRDLNQSLEDELDFLDHRRDMFIEGLNFSSQPAGKNTNDDVGRFERWLSEERRRLVRVKELQSEECWRKSMAARDNKGRTPLHWAASVCGTDDSFIHALITTGRADLFARHSNCSDQAIFAALKAQLRRETSNEGDIAPNKTSHGFSGNVEARTLFPCDREVHRRTGKLRRLRGRGKGCKAETKQDTTSSRDVQQTRHLDPYQEPDKLTATTAKVKWFCGALAKTAGKLSRHGGGGAEALLLSVFEDLDRSGDGTLSMTQFREALHDVNVRVSEQTLLEVGRYFKAPTVKHRRGRHQCDSHDFRHEGTRKRKDTATDWAVDISYVPLMDIAFGRKVVKEPRRGGSRRSEKGNEDPDDAWKEEPMYESRREKTAVNQPDAYSSEDCDGDSDGDHCYVDIGRIRAARVALIETADALGRSPLFLAAAAGAVPAARILIRHGAASTLSIDGTGLTPHSVAPNMLMRRVLAAEARQSLDQARLKWSEGRYLGGYFPGMTEGDQLAATACDAFETDETRRMAMWVSILAEDELAPTRASDSRVDQKTSLHLAATVGLLDSVKDLLRRGVGKSKDGGRRGSGGKTSFGENSKQPKWTTLSKPSDDIIGDVRLRTAHCAYDHQLRHQDVSDVAVITTDANGWSALHACCTEDSPQHLACALALLGAETDPNARTNTGRTPLHVAASAARSAEGGLIPLLVSHGSNLEACDADGLRPIHIAAKAGGHVALLALLTAGADPWSVTSRKWNALHFSVSSGTVYSTRILAFWDSDCGVLARQKNGSGVTALELNSANDIHLATSTIWEAAALGETERVSRACVESSRSLKDTTSTPWACPGVNRKTPGLGFTPLHACMAGLAAVTRGEDVSLPCTPPRPCSQGANVAARPSFYARLARRYGERAHRFRDRVDNKLKRSISTAAAVREKPVRVVGGRGDYIGVCQALVTAAADVSALDCRCRTPLALAAAAGSVDVVEMLLGAGADPRACDADGNTPLHFAFSYVNVAVAATLSKEGVDQHACNTDGKTPQDVAGLRAGLAIGESSVPGEYLS